MFFTLKKYWPLSVIAALEIVLFGANFSPGTYLVGWDNLYPELNFSANFDRSVFATWQEYRGLGLPDGMAHAANLPHALFIWLLNQFFPENLLRYVFVHLMHLTGGIGIYVFLRKKVIKDQGRIFPLAGALFYLFNLMTIQIFYAPLEVFLVHFAFLPWLIYALLNYLGRPSLKSLALFTLFSILSLPQGFVPQVFAAYLLLILLVLLFEFFRSKSQALSKIGVIILTIFSINAFWLLPYIYSAPGNSEIIREAKINQMSSGDIYLKNKARGNLGDVLLLKGFMLDVMEFNGEKYSHIMEPWRGHINSFLFSSASLLLLVLTLIGLGRVIVKNQGFYPFVVAFVLSGIVLGSDIWGIELLNTFVRTQFPILGEAFRFSFTKFGILFAFCYTVFLGVGISFLANSLEKVNLNLLKPVFGLIASLSLFAYAYPALDGKFLFDKLRLKIPEEYFQTIWFFENQPSGERIAIFPQPTFWSWRYRDWGYRGSDFFWYGIKQPTLDRAFDPWSRHNENYYWEISYALYSKRPELFEKVLEKYQVNWIIVDGHIINPVSPRALYFDELENIVVSSPKIRFIQKFGDIKVYRVDLETPANNYVFLAQNLPIIEPTYKWNSLDTAFIENGNYISLVHNIHNSQFMIHNSRVYPFRSIFTGKEQYELEFEIEEKEDMFIFRKHFDVPGDYYTSVPSVDPNKYVWIDPNNLSHQKFLSPDIALSDKAIEVYIPKIKGYLSASIAPTEIEHKTEKCPGTSNGKAENRIVEFNGKQLLRLAAIDTNNCSASFWLPNLSHNIGYIITASGRNVEGKKLIFWLENQNSRKADIETHLWGEDKPTTSHFIQPPMEDDGVGYTLHFDNISIGNQKTVNDLGEITINPLPYEFLTNLSLRPINQESKPVVYHEVKVEHPNPSIYKIGIRNQELGIKDPVLVLAQAYHTGWKAYVTDSDSSLLEAHLPPLFGEEIKNHVLVNNWANGWIMDRDGEIVIVFLPQYLEYIGFLLFGAYMLLLVIPGPLRSVLYWGNMPKDPVKEEVTQDIDTLEDEEGRHGHDPLRSPASEGEEETGGSAPHPASDDDTRRAIGEILGEEPEEGEPFSIAEQIEKAEKERRGMKG